MPTKLEELMVIIGNAPNEQMRVRSARQAAQAVLDSAWLKSYVLEHESPKILIENVNHTPANDWLEEHDRQIREAAFDEGASATREALQGWYKASNTERMYWPEATNPHKKGAE